MTLKQVEDYHLVDCEEEAVRELDQPMGSHTLGDSFTVETGLEDLEFGFSVIKNTQKVPFD